MSVDKPKPVKKNEWLLFAPFIVLGLLFPINLGGHLFVYPLLGVSESTGIAISMSLIGLGLMLGIIGVLAGGPMRWYWRFLVGILFIPAVGISLVISGM